MIHAGSNYVFGGSALATGICDITRATGAAATAAAASTLPGTTIDPGNLTNDTNSSNSQGQGITTVTGALPAGAHTFAVVCQQTDADLDWREMSLSAVMIDSGAKTGKPLARGAGIVATEGRPVAAPHRCSLACARSIAAERREIGRGELSRGAQVPPRARLGATRG